MPSLQRLARAALLALAIPAAAQAAAPLRYCVFDPLGTQGQAFGLARDFALVAKGWGVNLDLRAYTDERVASEDFKAGQCDGVAITGLRGRQYNGFTGSVDAIGGVPTFQHLAALLALLASPKMASYMVSGPYEVVGILPLGGAYVFVRDRGIDSIEKAAGKKIAVLDHDKSQARMVQQMGAQPVPSDIISYAGKFNNGQVDILAAPALLYKPLELYKGLGRDGAIYRFPLIQMTANLIIRRDRFPPDFAQKARDYALTLLPQAERVISQNEKDIPARYWMDILPSDQEKYVLMMREARIMLTRDGFYDPRMMALLKKVRCRLTPSAGECSDALEQ